MVSARGHIVRSFVMGVPSGLLHGECGQAEAERRVGEAEVERRGAQAVFGGDPARREGGDGDGPVAGGLVEAHREPAACRADEVDLHDHGGRPGEPLVDAEQDVGEHHPTPRRGPHQQQRDRDADDPAGDQHGFAAVAVREGAGEEVGGCLDDAERGDEREGGGVLVEPELVGGEQREDGAFLADHAADERVHADEEHELGEVLPEPEPDPRRCRCGGAHRPTSSARPVTVAQVSGPPSNTRAATPRAARRLAADMARSP